MPTLSASDYTSFIKARAASQAYKDGKIPVSLHTTAQPFASQSILNANLLATQAAALVTPTVASVIAVNGFVPRVRPFTGVGYVNHPKALSTVHNSTSTVQNSSKFPQVGGLPLTAAKSDGAYAPVAHLARVDTKATGAYRTVRQPV